MAHELVRSEGPLLSLPPAVILLIRGQSQLKPMHGAEAQVVGLVSQGQGRPVDALVRPGV